MDRQVLANVAADVGQAGWDQIYERNGKRGGGLGPRRIMGCSDAPKKSKESRENMANFSLVLFCSFQIRA